MKDRTFAKFSFFKVDPAWRRQEFLAACEDFGIDRSLRAYSTIGTRVDVDLVLEDIHTGRIMKSHIGIGRGYPEVTVDTTYSYGVDDQEYVVCFEGDDPGEFLALDGVATAPVPSSPGP